MWLEHLLFGALILKWATFKVKRYRALYKYFQSLVIHGVPSAAKGGAEIIDNNERKH